MNSIVNIFSDEVFCPLFKRHLVPLTGHYVRTKLSHTARNKVNFLLQENATFVELDKMATEQFWFEICRLSHIGCIARKSIPAAKIHHSTVEQLKLAIIDYTEIFFLFFILSSSFIVQLFMPNCKQDLHSTTHLIEFNSIFVYLRKLSYLIYKVVSLPLNIKIVRPRKTLLVNVPIEKVGNESVDILRMIQ